MSRSSFCYIFLHFLSTDTGLMTRFVYLSTLFWLLQVAILGQPYCLPSRAAQHVSQLTTVSQPTLPAPINKHDMLDRDWLLSAKTQHTELTPLVCDTFRQLGIHSNLQCQSKRKKRRPYRAGRRKWQGRLIPVLISPQNELLCPHRQSTSCIIIHG